MPKILALTPGDPAGIGPDLAIGLANLSTADKIVIIADRNLLAERARKLKCDVLLPEYCCDRSNAVIEVLHTSCDIPVKAGKGDPRHSNYVISTLNRAVDGCMTGEFDALVTGPVNKEMMNRSGLDFMGHTEYLAHKTGSDCPVMMLMNERMKVVLITTHIPLNEVAAQIDCNRIVSVVRVVHRDLAAQFGLESPRIGVCGLNPHAGEGGKLGKEEILEISPAIEILSKEGVNVSGPYPADTIFSSQRLSQFDVVVAMYHDQGLPVIKHASFGEIVNVTLGLPIVRTSVDHGTAYDIAGQGVADSGSLLQALRLAGQLAARR